jgi:hypothetical protein
VLAQKLAGFLSKNLTPEEEKQKLEFKMRIFGVQEKGTGGPQKRKRDLDNFFDGFDDF